MNITCQSCGQPLPKTVLVCPNCGGRQFSGNNLNQDELKRSHQANQTTQYHVSLASQLASQQVVPSQVIAPQVVPSQMTSQAPIQPIPQPQATVVTHVQNPEPVYEQSYTQYAPHAVTPSYLPPVSTTPLRQANTMRYAGFVRRGFAFAFDVAFFSLLTGLTWQYITNNKYKIMYVPNSDVPLLLAIAGAVLYLLVTAFLTSRARQGSIGKRMLGLWVFNMQGQRIGFFHAFFREVVKLGLLPLAFIMWFTARKQTVHDLIGRTVVLLDR